MSATDPVWMASFTTIRDTHDRVYATIDTAIQCEEAETPQLAIVNYKLSVMLIDQALETPVGLPGDADDQQVFELDETWDQACLMVQKMRRTRGELLQRIAQLTAKAPTPTASPLATVAEEQDEEFVLAVDCSAAAAASGERPWTHSELSKVLQQTVPPTPDVDLTNNIEPAESLLQLIYTCDGVRLYHITAGGGVSTSVENSVLRILCMPGNTERRLQATFFMQIIEESISVDASPDRDDAYDVVVDGVPIAIDAISDAAVPKFDRPWLYPLVPGVSPCYYTKFGAFIFPDLYADGDMQLLDASVGIVVPSDVELVVLDVLDAILLDVVREERADTGEESGEDSSSRARRSTSEQMSDNIVRGASYISRGLLFSSTKVGEFVERNTPYVMSKMTRVPQADDGERPVVSRGVVTGMEVAKKATGVAASLTGYVAEKVGVATMALGRYLSPHVQTTGSSLLTHTMGYSQEEAADKMSGVLIVAAGAVEGFGTVYTGLEQSASLLGTSLSNNTVRVIEHKYGASAGELAAGTFDTVGNVINISHNVSVLTPKSFVKRTAKNASKAMIQGYRPSTGAGARPFMTAKDLLQPDLAQFSQVVAAQK